MRIYIVKCFGTDNSTYCYLQICLSFTERGEGILRWVVFEIGKIMDRRVLPNFSHLATRSSHHDVVAQHLIDIEKMITTQEMFAQG